MMLSADQVSRMFTKCQSTDYLEHLRICGGFYECPKNKDGNRQGLLVAYRGEYEPGKRFVGDVYVNYAKVEQYPFVVFNNACSLIVKLKDLIGEVQVFCGAPEGGKCLATMMASMSHKRYVYPEKKGGELIWQRHQAQEGEGVVIVEDITNNFSTTEKIIKLIMDVGAKPVAIASFLNRSLTVDDAYHSTVKDGPLPVRALVCKKIQEYRQDDPEVAEDVRRELVVWDVKQEWPKLEQAMACVQV